MPSMPKTLAFVLLVGLFSLPGCETRPTEMPYQTMSLAEPVDLLYKAVGGHPSLKFNNESVVLATLGEMPTAGYWINITSINQVGDALFIYGQANRPGTDEMAGQVLTYPYCAVVIPRTGATTVRDEIDSVEGQDPPM
jgi:hypothetical protein